MNIPNKISIVRLCMTVVMVVVFLLGVYDIIPYGELYATAVYILASITDGIDGRIARKYGLITTLGKFLDSIADKILCLAAFILIAWNAPDVAYAPSVWVVVLVIVHVARDFMISALRQVCASENIIMAADKLGKVKAVFDYIAIPMLLAAPSLGELLHFDMIWIYLPGFILLGVATVMSLISAVNYLVVNKSVFKEKKVETQSKEDSVEQ